jgi:hypothetical protein
MHQSVANWSGTRSVLSIRIFENKSIILYCYDLAVKWGKRIMCLNCLKSRSTRYQTQSHCLISLFLVFLSDWQFYQQIQFVYFKVFSFNNYEIFILCFSVGYWDFLKIFPMWYLNFILLTILTMSGCSEKSKAEIDK